MTARYCKRSEAGTDAGTDHASGAPYFGYSTKKKSPHLVMKGLQKKAAAYSPTWCSSTIGADGLNFPVRNGKGWAPSPWPPKIVDVFPRPLGHGLPELHCRAGHLKTSIL